MFHICYKKLLMRSKKLNSQIAISVRGGGGGGGGPVWNVRFSCAGRIFIFNVVCAMNLEIYT